MLIRIVKLELKENEISNFLADFENDKYRIRNFEGCEKLNLLKEKGSDNVFFTYSYWKSEDDLERYRNSDLFLAIWKRTKPRFSKKAEAWSVINTDLIN